MKQTITVVVLLVCLCLAVTAQAQQKIQVNIGFTPMFGNISGTSIIKNTEITTEDNLGIGKRNTIYEAMFALYVKHLSVRGFYLIPKTIDGDGWLPAGIATESKDISKDKPLAIHSSLIINANRIEIGTPIRLSQSFLVEPMLVYSTISPSISITGEKYTYNHSPKVSEIGLGMELSERISVDSVLRLKYLATPKLQVFSGKYLVYNRNMFFGGGYNYTSYSGDLMNAKFHGPTIEAGVNF